MILRKFRFMRRIVKNNKSLFLAYDQGLEHGPTDFNDKNVDPNYIIRIAKEGGFTGVIFQKGIAEKYNHEIKASKVPLIVKLNGKTSLVDGDPVSRQLCTVKEALDLGACAVGYTIYIGSHHEEVMLREFEDIQRMAHHYGMPVIAWIYPRGSGIKGKKPRELLAYATRVGLEVGADIIKIHWDSSKDDLAWAVKSAGKARVVIAGGSKASEKKLLGEISDAVSVGVSGLAIGRNIWQAKNPLVLAEKIKKLLWS